MSRAPPRSKDSAPAPPQRPVPPPSGWTLMEAAVALCPREAGLYKEGGAALEAAVLHDKEDWVKLPRPPPYYSSERWLSDRLVRALCNRPDLQLTGRDMPQGIHAPRFRLPRDLLLLAAVEGNDYDTSDYGVSLQLSFGSDRALISSLAISGLEAAERVTG